MRCGTYTLLLLPAQTANSVEKSLVKLGNLKCTCTASVAAQSPLEYVLFATHWHGHWPTGLHLNKHVEIIFQYKRVWITPNKCVCFKKPQRLVIWTSQSQYFSDLCTIKGGASPLHCSRQHKIECHKPAHFITISRESPRLGRLLHCWLHISHPPIVSKKMNAMLNQKTLYV